MPKNKLYTEVKSVRGFKSYYTKTNYHTKEGEFINVPHGTLKIYQSILMKKRRQIMWNVPEYVLGHSGVELTLIPGAMARQTSK